MHHIKALGSSSIALGLLALAVFAHWHISNVPVGTMRHIGPGFLPRVLSVAIIVGSLIQIAIDQWQLYRKCYTADDDSDSRYVPIRAIVLIMVGVVAFALLVDTAGLLIAAFVSSFFTSIAIHHSATLVNSLIISLLLSVSVVVVFAYALGLHIKVFP